MDAENVWVNRKKFMRWATWKHGYKAWLLKVNGGPSSRRKSHAHLVYERFFFRGQGDASWALEPTFDRRNRLRAKKRKQLAESLVDRFVQQVKQQEPLDESRDPVAQTAIAQHFGLPTRLLDWSASPYIAAFFAFHDRIKSENFSGNIAIWALDTTTHEADTIINDECKFYRLTDHTNIRMGNQQGAFTLLETEDSDLRKFVKRNSQPNILTQFLIPASEAVEALDDLVLMGIHNASMFPDRQGAAAHVDMLSRLAELRENYVGDSGKVDARAVSQLTASS